MPVSVNSDLEGGTSYFEGLSFLSCVSVRIVI